MKKKYVVAVLGLSLMFCLSACDIRESANTQKDGKTEVIKEQQKGDSSTDDIDEDTVSPFYVFADKNDDNLAAMFYMGNGNAEQNMNFTSFVQKYSFDKNNFLIVSEKDNCEWYAIIPKYIGTSITVERVQLNEDSGNLEVTEKIVDTEKPILLCCNESDIIPSAKVTITYKDKTIEFNPCLSMEDGKLAKQEQIYSE